MEQIREQLANSVQSTEDGESSSLELLGHLKELGKFIKECETQIEDSAYNEFDMNCEGQKTIESFKGFKIEMRNGGWKYDYSKVPKYAQYGIDQKAFGEKLKALFEHSESTDIETGEVYDVTKKPRKDSYNFKLITQ